jgi:hypothetical protein
MFEANKLIFTSIATCQGGWVGVFVGKIKIKANSDQLSWYTKSLKYIF